MGKTGRTAVWEGKTPKFCSGYVKVQMPIRLTNESIKETVGYIHLELKRLVRPGDKIFGVINIKIRIKTHGSGQDDLRRA